VIHEAVMSTERNFAAKLNHPSTKESCCHLNCIDFVFNFSPAAPQALSALENLSVAVSFAAISVFNLL
jgi:hypothetical protein